MNRMLYKQKYYFQFLWRKGNFRFTKTFQNIFLNWPNIEHSACFFYIRKILKRNNFFMYLVFILKVFCFAFEISRKQSMNIFWKQNVPYGSYPFFFQKEFWTEMKKDIFVEQNIGEISIILDSVSLKKYIQSKF